jgi:hypothetical protein
MAEQWPAAKRTKSDRLRVSAAFLHGKAPGRINKNAPTEKSTTHGEGSDQLPRTVGNSRQGHTGVAEAAGNWRLGLTVYELCSFCLKDRSVTSANVQWAFVGGGGIPPPSTRGKRGTTPQPPPWSEHFPAAQRT